VFGVHSLCQVSFTVASSSVLYCTQLSIVFNTLFFLPFKQRDVHIPLKPKNRARGLARSQTGARAPPKESNARHPLSPTCIEQSTSIDYRHQQQRRPSQ